MAAAFVFCLVIGFIIIVGFLLESVSLDLVIKTFEPGLDLKVYTITTFSETLISEEKILKRKDRVILVEDVNTKKTREVNIVEELLKHGKKVVLLNNGEEKYSYIWDDESFIY